MKAAEGAERNARLSAASGLPTRAFYDTVTQGWHREDPRKARPPQGKVVGPLRGQGVCCPLHSPLCRARL